MLWINYFSLKHLWSTPSRGKKFWAHPCAHCWFRVPSHGDTHNVLFPFSLMPTVTAPASFARLELWHKNHLPYVYPRNNANTLTFVMFPQSFFSHLVVFSNLWSATPLVLFRWMDSPYWNRLTMGAPLLRMFSLHIHNLLCLIIDLWRTSSSELLEA